VSARSIVHKHSNHLAGVVNYPEKGISPLMAGTRRFCLFRTC